MAITNQGKIDQLIIDNSSFDIDLPVDATPSIASLTVSGAISEGGTSLSSKYLGISAKAADAAKLNGQAASYYAKASDIPSVSNATITIKQTGIDDQTFTLNGSAATITLADTNTTYTFAEGSTNKSFTVTPSGGTAQTVVIHGLGDASLKGVSTTVASGNSNLVTSGAVWTAIDNLPEPMVFKGTLGTGGTITTLPTAAAANEGFTYKVITAGTYASQAAKVGDVFVSNGSAWVIIPAGDSDTDTWRAIKVNGTQLLGSALSTGAINFKNGGNITITGSGNDITIAATDTTYNFSGVTFVSGNSTAGSHAANDMRNGHYYYTTDGPSTSLGASTDDGAIYSQAYSDSWVAQIAQDYRNGRLFVRGKNNGTWQNWIRIAQTGEAQPASDVSSWAKASTKPSYSASEVGALPSSTTIQTGSSGVDVVQTASWDSTTGTLTLTSTKLSLG